MKKLYIIMILFLFCIFGCGKIKTIEKDGLLYVEKEQKLYNGTLINKNADTREEIEYKDGKMNGIYKTYSITRDINNRTSETLLSEENYKDNVLDGFSKYYSNGFIEREISYVNNKKNGPMRLYYNAKEYNEKVKQIYNKEYSYYSEKNQKYQMEVFERTPGLKTMLYLTRGQMLYTLPQLNGEPKLILIDENISVVEKEITFKDDIQIGKIIEYAADGKKILEYSIDKDKVNGEYKIYNCMGRTMEKYTYKDGNKEGEYTIFSYEGKFVLKGYYKNNKKHGIWEKYYENGNVAEKIQYDNDKRIGKYYSYYDNGAIMNEFEYVYGDRNGEIKQYYDTRELQSIGHYENGLQTGQWTEYHKNGSIKSAFSFENGKLSGEMKIYYDSGEVFAIRSFIGGEGEGNWIRYYKSRKVLDECLLKKGLKVGKYLAYHENGEIWKKGNYDTNGKRNGEWSFYDENGILDVSDDYENGVASRGLRGRKLE